MLSRTQYNNLLTHKHDRVISERKESFPYCVWKRKPQISKEIPLYTQTLIWFLCRLIRQMKKSAKDKIKDKKNPMEQSFFLLFLILFCLFLHLFIKNQGVRWCWSWTHIPHNHHHWNSMLLWINVNGYWMNSWLLLFLLSSSHPNVLLMWTVKMNKERRAKSVYTHTHTHSERGENWEAEKMGLNECIETGKKGYCSLFVLLSTS